MKASLLLLVLVFFASITSYGQNDTSGFSGIENKQARDPRSDLMNFIPNEVLVKFKDEVQVKSGTNLKSAGISAVDLVLEKHGTDKLEKLFPTEKMLKSARTVKDPQGRDMIIPSLHNIYKIVLPELKSTNSQPADIFRFIEELKALPEVEYAEPNYIYSIDKLEPVGPELTASDLKHMQSNNPLKNATAAVVPNDPLYSEQWYIPAIKADLVWEQTTGDSSQVIAILDTGVDTEHPDLKNKIWRNPDEIPGNGMDDDGNGFPDDYMGWDFINNDNNPMDDNSHGTHVAGIAAAESNNGIGIAGVNWHAKIMPIKVFQSSGRGDASTISQGIIYAMNNGATVINMSFGSYAHSMTMENALANAYASAVLVAAAGNDGIFLEQCNLNENDTIDFESNAYFGGGSGSSVSYKPMFPAAHSFILGVQSPESNFSNLDCNGPTFSTFSEMFNYEMKAPGTNVISTIPNGNYKTFQGTSMATPMIAGAVALFRSVIPASEKSNEFMWVQIIQATEQFLDIHKALTIIAKPEIWFHDKVIIDTLSNGNRDGLVDAGETIKLWFRARNTGGKVDSLFWKIQLAELKDTSVCKILKEISFIESIEPYAIQSNENDPMIFQVELNAKHNHKIAFNLLSWIKGAQDTTIQTFIINTQNAEELKGMVGDTLTLFPNKTWLIKGSFKITPDGVLIIKPGTNLQINSKLINEGQIIALGTKDSLIIIEGTQINGETNTGKVFFHKVILKLNQPDNTFGPFYNQYGRIEHSFLQLSGRYGMYDFSGEILNSRLFNWSPWSHFIFSYQLKIKYSNIDSPNCAQGNLSQGYIDFSFNNFTNIPTITSPWNTFLFSKPNNIIGVKNNYVLKTGSSYFQENINQYWGTSDSVKIENLIYDFLEDASLSRIIFSPFLKQPSDSCHAIVWKVLVNGKDAQDEVVDPLGVGKHRFDVYFNRPMDKTYIPQVSFGVRYPFNQQTVNENGNWSEDGRIYTAYKSIKLTTGDGINRIRVSGAKEADGWDWEIPVEDQRFEFLISAASSASNEFMATPGLGKVSLEWNDNDLEDGLGYNMYRMEQINDSTLSEPMMVNNILITDTLYTDFAVTPNKKYFYYYKILRTNFEETDSSRVVAAIPFTADLGDANGDLQVNVSDIVTVVNFIMENNPAPFIFEAADINGDGIINVLDIVGITNLILSPKSASLKGLVAENAEISIEDDIVYINSPVKLGGIQFTLADINSEQEVEILEALSGFEVVKSMKDGKLMVLAFSLSGKTIGEGKSALLKLTNQQSWIFDAVLSNTTGNSIDWNFTGEATGTDLLKLNSGFELGQNYPNPFTGNTTIPFALETNVEEVVISVYDIMGRELKNWQLKTLNSGSHKVEWSNDVQTGILIYRMHIRKNGMRSYTQTRKMVVQ